MRQFTRREEERVQLYFNCLEKMDYTERMLKRVDYMDTMFTMEVGGENGPAKLKVKFGKGWMGKGAEIHRVNNLKGEPKGIMVLITISESTYPYDCCIESKKNKKDGICLGIPTGITHLHTHPEVLHIAERQEEAEEMDEIHREVGEISDEILNWEEETLNDMQIEAEMEEALQGQID